MIDLTSFIEDAAAASIDIQEKLQKNSASLYEKLDIGAGGDISYGADIMAEKIYVSYLKKYAKIDSEESGIIGEGKYTIYLDPLDGSDNFKTNFPYYGSSIALCDGDETLAAVIVNFISSEIFIRTKNEFYKTYLNDLSCKLDVLENNSLSSVGIVEKAYADPKKTVPLKENHLKFRSPGAIALSLAYAHYVKYMLFFGTMRVYDIQAGLYMCKDLNVYMDDEIIIISKDDDLFKKLCKLYNKEPF
ncbi:inositol monophosphatase family protein [Sulfurimonas sp. HSL-1716]|uniref:inositol monophosphatase family protein n=1 Tax=Hydrocurvibacter sulfurireducens TaxID=3131937 RepID=UPI0031F7B258